MDFCYPISLNMTGKKCLVAGGGKVAQRKILALLTAGAAVVMVAPRITAQLQELADKGQVSWINSEYQENLLKDVQLVFAATDNRQVNSKIARDCQRRGLLVNVADSPEESDFSVNSFYRQGDLLIAVSTNGKSPYLAARIAAEIGRNFGPEYAALLTMLGEARKLLAERIPDPKKRERILRRLLSSELIELVLAGKNDQAWEEVKKCLSLS